MIYLISWLTDCALFLFIFAGTRALAEQGASPVVLGALGASFFLAAAVNNAISGRLADRVGRRRVSFCGALLMIISLWAVASFPTGGWSFYIAYTCVGLSIGLIYPPLMALLEMGKSGRAAGRAYLWFCLAFNTGIVSGQLLGGWLFVEYGPRSPLLVAMALMAINAICITRIAVPAKTVADPQSGEEHERADAPLARAFARLTWIANFGGMFSMSILWFQFPVLVVDLDVRADAHGAILALGRIVVMSTYCLMHVFRAWEFRFTTGSLAQSTGMIGLVVLATASSPLGLAIGVAALSLLMGYNYFAGLVYNARGNTHETKGKAFGLMEASLGFGAAGGSLVGGWANASLGPRAPFLLAVSIVASLLLLQLGAYWRFVHPLREAKYADDAAACATDAV